MICDGRIKLTTYRWQWIWMNDEVFSGNRLMIEQKLQLAMGRFEEEEEALKVERVQIESLSNAFGPGLRFAELLSALGLPYKPKEKEKEIIYKKEDNENESET